MTFFSELARHLARGPVALATVVAARGSTPRITGARQAFLPTGESFGSVGGGVAEARMAELARATLADGAPREWQADLRGRPGEPRDGVCGGVMTIAVQRLEREHLAAVTEVAETLAHGRRSTLALGGREEVIEPGPRLLVLGAGHIGRALAPLAAGLDFSVLVQDDRAETLGSVTAETTPDLEAAVAALARWEGERYAVLVTRGIAQDLVALPALSAANPLTYVGLLGSRKRVATVLAEAGPPIFADGVLHAPVGVEIGAETPAEIAVSIAAEMIAVRRRSREAAWREKIR